MNRSPKRGSFRTGNLIRRVEQDIINTDHVQEMIDFHKSWEQRRLELEETSEWKENNMEYDLRSTSWICDKVKSDDVYAETNMHESGCECVRM